MVRAEIGRSNRACAWVLVCGLGWAAGAAQAANSSYLCSDGQILAGQFTPRDARLTLKKTLAPGKEESRKWTLQRLRQAGQAQYKEPGGEVSLVLARSQAELTLAKDTPPLVCKLQLSEFTARPSGY